MSILKRFIVCGDNHGNLVCEESIKKFFEFSANWNPHYRIHLGDLWDFSALRRGASAEEKMLGISDDYQAGINFLDRYKPHFLTLGNHDDRIWQHTVNCRKASCANGAKNSRILASASSKSGKSSGVPTRSTNS